MNNPSLNVNDDSANVIYEECSNYDLFSNREFPMFVKVIHNQVEYKKQLEKHGLFDVICKSKEIISKTGGMTLMDSVVSETPIIYLEPLGIREQKNADFLEGLKIGMSYDEWASKNYSVEVLHELHLNIVKHKQDSLFFTSEYWSW